MFTDYNGHGHGPIHHGQPGHYPGHHPMQGYGGPPPPPPPHHHPAQYNPYMRPRVDPASDVFTCLFGDLFVKW